MAFNFRGDLQERGVTDRLYSSSGSFLAEQAAAGFDDSAGATLWRATARAMNTLGAWAGVWDRGPILTGEEATKRYGASGLKWDKPVRVMDAEDQVTLRRRKDLRDRILADAQVGWGTRAAGFASYMVGNLANPVDAALAFIPVVKTGQVARAGIASLRAETGLEGLAGLRAVPVGGRWQNALREATSTLDGLRPTMVGLESTFGKRLAPYASSVIEGSVGNMIADFPHLLEDQTLLQRPVTGADYLLSFAGGGAAAAVLNFVGRAVFKTIGTGVEVARVAQEKGFLGAMAHGARKLARVSSETKDAAFRTAVNDIVLGKPASHTDMVLRTDPGELGREALHLEAVARIADGPALDLEDVRGRPVPPPVLAALATAVATDPSFDHLLQALARDVVQEAGEGANAIRFAEAIGVVLDENAGAVSPFRSVSDEVWNQKVAARSQSLAGDAVRDAAAALKAEELSDGRSAVRVAQAIEAIEAAKAMERPEYLFADDPDGSKAIAQLEADTAEELARIERDIGPLPQELKQLLDAVDQAFPELPDLSPVTQCLLVNG